ncbi:MAG: divergent PAP2 family protein [Candidatus Gracilibacteria bacterium]|nr:divergent PAP2 family protein [Candidatus Gracilibacteria bacterium]
MEYNFFYTYLISIPVISFLFAVTFKGVSTWLKTGKIDIKRALGSGGMPSVHSALVVSTTTAMAIKYGISSDLFAIALSFTVIILYDAINVRFEAGLHASAINKLLGEKFKEHLGHLPSEAFAGSILGIATAVFLYII